MATSVIRKHRHLALARDRLDTFIYWHRLIVFARVIRTNRLPVVRKLAFWKEGL